MSFSSLSINQNRAVNDLSKYVIGASINQQEEPSGIVSGAAMMGGISGGIWTWQNRKDLKGGFKKLAQNAQTQKNIVNSTKKYAPSSRFSTIRNKWAGAGEYTSKAELEALSQKLAKKPEYAKLKSYIDNALKSGKNYTAALKDVDKLKAIENLNKYNAKVASQMAKGSTLRSIKNATGITKLSKATKELAAKSGKFRGLLKGVKGNAGFAAISLGIGVLCDVVPAFGLSTEKGFKQLGKTAVKTGCEVAGWAAGSALGAKAGALIGTCIGGPIGTVVGGAIGLIGGFVGSFLASKAADKIVGPSEVELAEKKAANQIARSAKTSPETMDELALTSYEQLVEKAKTGQLDENDLKAKEALEQLLGCKINLEEEVKAATEATAATQTTSQTPTATQVNTETNQATELATNDKTSEKEPEESSVSNTTTQQQTSVPGYSMYLNPFNNMFLNSMYPNLYASNQYTNPYTNDMYFTKMFGTTPTIYPTTNQGNTFQYTL